MELLLNKNTGGTREVVFFRTDLDNSQIHFDFVKGLLETGNYELITKED